MNGFSGMLKLAMLALLASSLLFCGGSSKRQEIDGKVRDFKSRMRAIEASLAANDVEGQKILSECANDLKQVERLIIEDDFSAADGYLVTVGAKLAQFAQPKPTTTKASGLSPKGTVSWQNLQGDRTRLDGGESLLDIRNLSTAARSLLEIRPFNGAMVRMLAQTELTIRGFDQSRNHLELSLERGACIVEKTNTVGKVTVQLGNAQLIMDKPGKIEINYQAVAKRRYVSVLDGQVTCAESGKTEILTKYLGFIWDQSGGRQVQTPTGALVDSPVAGGTIYTAESGEAEVGFRWRSRGLVPFYQLQVSSSQDFISRVFDNFSLERSMVDVSLKPGTYYWRVRGLSKEKVPGPYTQASVLNVSDTQIANVNQGVSRAKDDVPGPKIDKLDVKVISSMVIVAGKTDPNVKVNVNGVAAVMLASGDFRAVVTFESTGEHNLRIFAMNPKDGGETIMEKKVKITF